MKRIDINARLDPLVDIGVIHDESVDQVISVVKKLIKESVAAERERCAQVVEHWNDRNPYERECMAASIRVGK